MPGQLQRGCTSFVLSDGYTKHNFSTNWTRIRCRAVHGAPHAVFVLLRLSAKYSQGTALCAIQAFPLPTRRLMVNRDSNCFDIWKWQDSHSSTYGAGITLSVPLKTKSSLDRIAIHHLPTCSKSTAVCTCSTQAGPATEFQVCDASENTRGTSGSCFVCIAMMFALFSRSSTIYFGNKILNKNGVGESFSGSKFQALKASCPIPGTCWARFSTRLKRNLSYW